MLVDVTEVLNEGRLSDPLALADLLRRKVREKTGCSASVGMGPNPLLARMATRRAKPDGMFLLGQGGYSIDILEFGRFFGRIFVRFWGNFFIWQYRYSSSLYIHWISLSTWDLGLVQIRVIRESCCKWRCKQL